MTWKAGTFRREMRPWPLECCGNDIIVCCFRREPILVHLRVLSQFSAVFKGATNSGRMFLLNLIIFSAVRTEDAWLFTAKKEAIEAHLLFAAVYCFDSCTILDYFCITRELEELMFEHFKAISSCLEQIGDQCCCWVPTKSWLAMCHSQLCSNARGSAFQ